MLTLILASISQVLIILYSNFYKWVTECDRHWLNHRWLWLLLGGSQIPYKKGWDHTDIQSISDCRGGKTSLSAYEGRQCLLNSMLSWLLEGGRRKKTEERKYEQETKKEHRRKKNRRKKLSSIENYPVKE